MDNETEIERLKREIERLQKALSERRQVDVISPSATKRSSIESLTDSVDFVTDMCRYAEGVLTEKQIRKKWRELTDTDWERAGSNDALVRAIEETKLQRVRNGAAKSERAQQYIVRGPDILATIMDDPQANARHRVDSIKALNAIADPGPENAVAQRFFIRIDLSADTKDPKDVLTFETMARPNTPKQIEDDHGEQSSDKWRR